ncbi:MAG: hypothetical protein L3K06_05275, partial [Thermoplasmata archaeon]|nr:hypothetical protein [Thermoplasmata archaeon]
DAARSARTAAATERFAWVKGLARVALLVGGVTWSLTMFADWTRLAPGSAGGGHWFHWIFQQQLPAMLAVGAALAPSGLARWFGRHASRAEGWLLRAALLVGGISLIAWMPPALVTSGVVGWTNELLGALGLAASAGAVSAAPIEGWGLVFHWGFQLVLLGILSLVIALGPTRALGWLAPQSAAAPAGSFPTASPTSTESPALATASAPSSEP